MASVLVLRDCINNSSYKKDLLTIFTLLTKDVAIFLREYSAFIIYNALNSSLYLLYNLKNNVYESSLSFQSIQCKLTISITISVTFFLSMIKNVRLEVHVYDTSR